MGNRGKTYRLEKIENNKIPQERTTTKTSVGQLVALPFGIDTKKPNCSVKYIK